MPVSEANKALIEHTLPGWTPCTEGWEIQMNSGALNRVIDAARSEAAAELKARAEGTAAGRDWHIDNAAELLAMLDKLVRWWNGDRMAHPWDEAEALVNGTAKAEESSAKAPDAARVRVQTVGWWDDEDGEGRYFRFVCKLDGDTPPVWPFGLIWNSAFTLAPLPTPPKAEADHG